MGNSSFAREATTPAVVTFTANPSIDLSRRLAGLAWEPEIASLIRRHNNANALCLGGRVVGAGLGCQIVDAFLNAEFEGGRHQMRIDKMMALENH